MKRALIAIGIGALSSLLLLAAPFILPVDSAPTWLSRLIYGPGNQLFSWLGEHGHVLLGEGAHHGVVLAASLFCWWSIGGVAAYLLAGPGYRS